MSNLSPRFHINHAFTISQENLLVDSDGILPTLSWGAEPQENPTVHPEPFETPSQHGTGPPTLSSDVKIPLKSYIERWTEPRWDGLAESATLSPTGQLKLQSPYFPYGIEVLPRTPKQFVMVYDVLPTIQAALEPQTTPQEGQPFVYTNKYLALKVRGTRVQGHGPDYPLTATMANLESFRSAKGAEFCHRLCDHMDKLVTQPLREAAIRTVIMNGESNERYAPEAVNFRPLNFRSDEFTEEDDDMEPLIREGHRLPLLIKMTGVFLLYDHDVESRLVNNDQVKHVPVQIPTQSTQNGGCRFLRVAPCSST